MMFGLNSKIKRIFSLFLCCVLLAGNLPIVLATALTTEETKVYLMKTNYRENPLGIDDLTPDFNWAIDSSIRGEKQEAYRLVVSTDEDLSNVVWDSGKVESSDINVTYTGDTLEYKTKYYWKVTAYTSKSGQIDSEVATFETALGGDFGTDNKWIYLGEKYIDCSNGTLELKFTMSAATCMIDLFNFRDTEACSTTLSWKVDITNKRIQPHVMDQPGAVNRPYRTLDASAVEGLEQGIQCELKIEFNNGAHTTYLNGVNLGTDKDVANNTAYSAAVGRLRARSGCTIDEFKVTDSNGAVVASSNEPECTLGMNYINLTEGVFELNFIPTAAITEVNVFNFEDSASNPTTLMLQLDSANARVRPYIMNGNNNGAGSNRFYYSWSTANVKDFAVGKECTLKIEFNKGKRVVYLNGTSLGTDNALMSHEVYPKTLGRVTIKNGADLIDYTVKDSSGALIEEGPVYYTEPTDYAAVYFRKQFTLEQALSNVSKARLYSTAAGNQIMYMNGAKSSDDYMAPGKSQYTTTVYYQTYDVKDQLLDGDNTVAAEVGQGWYNAGPIGANYAKIPGAYGRVGLKAKLIITYKDGSEQIIDTDNSWSSTNKGPTTTNRYYIGQHVDSRKAIKNWNKNDSTSNKWLGVNAVDKFGTADGNMGELTAEIMEPVRVYEIFKPTSVTNPEGNKYIYKLDQNIAGTARITATAPRGTKITVKYAEFLKDGKVDWFVDSVCNGHNGTDEYIFSGDPNGETIEFDLVYHGFQYIEIDGLSEPLDFNNVECLALSSDLETTYTFDNSNETLNQYVQNIYYTLRANFVSSLTDCPTREKNTWTGDAQLISATASYFLNTYNSYLNFEEMLSVSQMGDGSITETVPEQRKPGATSGMGAERVPPAGWADAVVIIPWEMYNQYGDTNIIKEYYQEMKNWVDHLYTKRTYFAADTDPAIFDGFSESEIETEIPKPYYISEDASYVGLDSLYGDHLAYYNGVDGLGYWESPTSNTNLHRYRETSYSEVRTAYSAYSCKLLSEMAAAIGETEDAEKYHDLYVKYANSWRKNFVAEDGYTALSGGQTTVTTDEEGNKVYTYNPNSTRKYNGVEYDNIGTQTSYAMGLYFDLYLNEDGTVDEEAKLNAAKNLAKLLEYENYSVTVGIVAIRYIFDALSQNGQFDAALKALENEKYPSLLNMVVNGATTTWENYQGTMSRNHYIYGSGGGWIFSDVAGIGHGYENGNQAYTHFNLTPNYSSSTDTKLNYTNASYTSVSGKIESGWTISKDRNTFTYNCTVPANTTATLELPIETDNVIITESGTAVANADGVEFVEARNGKYIYELSSGKFEFVVNYPIDEHICIASEEFYNDGDGNHYNKCVANDRCREKLNVTACSGGVATCTEKAICAICGKAYGELLPHQYVEKIDNEFLVSGATFDKNAIYYKSCKDCELMGTETFEANKKQWFNVDLHNTSTSGGADRIGVKTTSPLKAGVEYTVSFDFESNKKTIGGSSINLCISGANGTNNIFDNLKKHLYSTNKAVFSSEPLTNIGTANHFTAKFTLTEEQVTYSNYFVWFYIQTVAGETDYIRISDFKLVESQDKSNTNLLEGKVGDENLNNWYWEYGKMSGTEYARARYTAKMITTDVGGKSMLHVNMNFASKGNNRFGVNLNESLVAGEEYVISFKYKSDYIKYGSGLNLFLTGGTSANNLSSYTNVFAVSKSALNSNATLLTNYGNDTHVIHKFTPTEDQINAGGSNHQLWFYMECGEAKNFDIYIYEFEMYKTSSKQKTNILPLSNSDKSLGSWLYTSGKMSGNEWNNGTLNKVRYIEYAPSMFESVFTATITYANADNERVGQKLAIKPEAGVEYIIDYDFQSENISHSSNVNLWVAASEGAASSLWGVDILRSQTMSGNYLLEDIDTGKGYRFKFTLDKDEVANYDNFFVVLYINVNASGTYDFSMYDFTVYRADDPFKTNLLANDNFSSTLDAGWYWTYGKMSGKEWSYNRYDTVKYVPYGGGDANADAEFDIRDLVMVDELIAEKGKNARNPMADFNRDDVLNEVDKKTCHQKLLKLK